MATKLHLLGALILAGLLAAGCGGRKKADPTDTSDRGGSTDSSGSGAMSSKELAKAAANLKKGAPLVGAELGKAVQAMGDVVAQTENVTITPVDFRALKELLPEAVGALKRSATPTGERQMGVSSAECAFEDGAGAGLTIKLIDTGSMRAMLAAGAAMAMSLDLDKETETGYERNTVVQGCKAHEKMDGDDGELTALVADRFLVEIRGNGIKADQLKAAFGAVPLKKLEAMKDQGIEKKEPAG